MKIIDQKFSIVADNLSKKYLLQDGKRKNEFLRDEISNFLSNPFKKNEKERSFWALKNVSFAIKKGEAIGIIGPNGAGKSTLLRILSRITKPTSGKVYLNGRVASLLEIGTGFNLELSGRENVFLNGAILGMKRAEIKAKFKEIIKFAGIEKFVDMPVKHYSSGMYIRLAFSIAACLESEILVIDEVLAVGDAIFQKKSLRKMNEVTKEKGRTVLFVSHDLNAVKRLCERTMLIDKGRLLEFGPTDKVVDKYLGKVNKNIPKPGKDIKKEVLRQGTGEIKITKIYISNKTGKGVQTVRSGDDINVHLKFEAKKGKNINDLLVGLLFKTELGQPVFLTHNFMSGANFGFITGGGEFIVKLKNLPLTAGKYYVNYSLMKKNGTTGEYYDNIDDAFSLQVNFGDYFKTSILPLQVHGSTLVPAIWKIKQI